MHSQENTRKLAPAYQLAMTRNRTCPALIVFAALALGACGSSSKAATPTTQPPAATTTATEAPTEAATTTVALDACKLVPKAKAEAVLGKTLQDAVTTSPGDCQYTADPNGPVAQFNVYIGDGAKTYYNDDSTVLQHKFTDVPGLGDESHEEDYAIFFRKGGTWVGLALTSLDEASTFKARLEALAKDVASQM